jgi:hypothetical protein
VNIGGNAHGAPGGFFFQYAGDWKIPAAGQRAIWNVLPDGKEGEYLTDRLTDEAVKFIRDCGDKPFFLYFPHTREPLHRSTLSSGIDKATVVDNENSRMFQDCLFQFLSPSTALP